MKSRGEYLSPANSQKERPKLNTEIKETKNEAKRSRNFTISLKMRSRGGYVSPANSQKWRKEAETSPKSENHRLEGIFGSPVPILSFPLQVTNPTR